MADEVAAPSKKEADSASDSEPDTVGADVDESSHESSDVVSTAAEPESTAAEITEVDDAEASDTEAEADASDDEVTAPDAKPRTPMSPVRLAMIAGLVLVVALGGLAGWLGYKYNDNRQAQAQRELFLAVGRQGATNLTSVDFEHAEADVQRVLDSATGAFYDQFQGRAEPFTEVVKQAKSKSVGKVNAAAIESESGDKAVVLVAVTVNSSNAGAPEQAPRNWRMKITVQKDGDGAKVSNVDFVQ